VAICDEKEEDLAVQPKDNVDQFEHGVSNILKKSLEKYFDSHRDNLPPSGLYNRIVTEVEMIMFEVTLNHVNGNQLQASKILGISRNTLRKKMRQFGQK
jgi:two-component system nitrogen regulation response regulator GlnG